MKTMALLYPGCVEFEIMLACEILNDKFRVDVITPYGLNHIGSNGMTIQASGGFESVEPQDYKVILIPGGNPEKLIGNELLNQILKKAYSKGVILAAICAGPILLDQAELLTGLRIAHGYEADQIETLIPNGFFKGVELTSEALIEDDQIITAKPDAFIDFSVAIAHRAGVVKTEKKEFWQKYYRGQIEAS